MARRAAAGAPEAAKKSSQQRLFEEAVQLFNKQGYVGTSIRDLAAAVGILPGSVYAHIDGKYTLLVQLVERGVDEYLAATSDLAGTAEQQLRGLIDAHVNVIAANIDLALVVFHQWRHIEGADRQRIMGKRSAYEQRIRGIVDLGVESGEFRPDIDCRVAVLAILGNLNWCPEWFSPVGRDPAAKVSKGLAEIILAGVRRGSPTEIA
jgi:TetR/AcrR family transcriptional regulator, cholesterol catabolism regulator